MKNKIKIIFLIFILFLSITSCKKEEYNIKFTNTINTTIQDVKIKEGELIKEPSLNVPDGYEFLGWYNGDEKWNFEAQKPTSNLTLTAKYNLIKYTVTYQNTLGLTNNNPTSFTVETNNITLENLEKAGYEFLGWYNDNEKVEEIKQGTTTNLTLTAKFTPIQYQITYINDGSEVENPSAYNIETKDFKLNNPKKEGYTFLGWYNDNEKVEEIKQGTTGNITLTAKYSPVEYTITYINSGKQTENPESYTVETNTFKLNSPKKEGHTFLGWYNGNEKIEEIKQGTIGNMTLTAKFETNLYLLTIIDGDTEVSKTEVPFGTLLSKYNLTKEDHVFLGWVDNLGNQITEVAMPANDLTVYASWKAEYTVYKITYDLNGGNWPKDVEYKTRLELVNGFINDYATFNKITVTAANFFDVSYNYPIINFFKDATYSLKWSWLETYIVAIAKETAYAGYTYLSDRNNEYYNTYMRSNLDGFLNTSLHATWPASMDFTKEQLANGYYDYMPGEETEYPTSFTYITPTFTLVAPVKDNMVFIGWYTEDNILVTEIKQGTRGDINLIAHFEAAEYQITYILDGGSSEGLITKYYSNLSEKLYLTQSKKSGSAFLGWYETADFSGTEKYFIEPGSTKEYTLYAKWTEEQLGSHKTISFYGDSITTFENYIPSDGTFYYPIYSSTVKQVELTWWKRLMAQTGTTFFTNISYSGSTVRGSSTSCGENDTRISLIAKNNIAPDILIIYLGINDCASGYSKEDFQSSYENMLTKIKKAYPTTEIFICTLPYETWTDGSNPDGKNYPGLRESYNEVIKELAVKYSVNLLDIEPCITKATESMASRTYLGDNIHPNAAGMERIANKIAEELKKHYK